MWGCDILHLTNSCSQWGNGILRMARSLHHWYNSHHSVNKENVRRGLIKAIPTVVIVMRQVDSLIRRHGSDKWCLGKTIWELTTGGESPLRKEEAELLYFENSFKSMMDHCLLTCVAALCPPWRSVSDWFGHSRPLVDPQCRTHTLEADLQLRNNKTQYTLDLARFHETT